MAARNISSLRVCGRAGLILPGKVLLQDESELGVRLAVTQRIRAGLGHTALVRAVALGKSVEEVLQERLKRSAHRRLTERRVGHKIAVVFADPVDRPVASSITDQHVTTGAAVTAIFEERMRVRLIVQ